MITVGPSRPVNSSSLDIASAVSMIPARASWASTSCLAGSASNCSMYIRMVAPEDPVPERRKMIREPSVKTNRRPWLVATLLSIGSV